MRSLRAVSAAWMAISVMTACGPPQEPARHAVEDAQSALGNSAPQAQRFLPEQFAALQVRTANLKSSYDHGDFKQVLNDAPTLLNDIQAMRAAATARQAAADKVLSGEWEVLAGSIPDRLNAVQERIEALATDKKVAAKVDLAGARAFLSGIDEQWSHAQEAFNAGDLSSAVEAAHVVRSRIDAAAKSLKLALPETARS